MKIVLTGGTGYIGSAVLRRLLSAGHSVTAVVRSDASAVAVRAAGARALPLDLFDEDATAKEFGAADAVIHTATTNDGNAQAFDRSVAGAAVRALGGTGRPYVHTGGVWVYGNGTAITEAQPFDPPALTAWRPDVEKLLADLTATIVVPGIVYGHGKGIPALLTDGRLVGDGSQHWSTVHVDDLADLYLLAVERGEALGHVIAVAGADTVRELAEAAAGDVVPESAEESRQRLGGPFADALLLDQVADAAKARALGWAPHRPSLVDEFRVGYRA